MGKAVAWYPDASDKTVMQEVFEMVKALAVLHPDRERK